jgi:prolyl-tRNA synthetase
MEKNTKKQNFSQWYHKILEDAEIVDTRYPVKGMLVYKKWGLFIIRQMQRHLEKLLEDVGHDPCLFPVLIPDDILGKETEHIAGFEQQVFWVTHAGANPLERRLALRPTSETPVYEMFSLWVRSHTDLPLKVHQSVAVYRYETKHTRPLIRGREFLWNEGHSVHGSLSDAEGNIEEINRIYGNLIREFLCIPFIINKRPEWDRFPGALDTFAFDTLMPDGKTLQIATAHNLGQNFSRVFDIEFETEDGKKEHGWQSSYGPSFGRLLAALISIHGDDKGLVLPPEVAPIQVIIVPILFKKTQEENKGVLDYAKEIEDKLNSLGIRVKTDAGDEHPGAKYYKWEMRGVPIRVEVGPRDLKAGKVTVARRDNGSKSEIGFDEIEGIEKMFADISDNLKEKAEEKFEGGFFKAGNMGEIEDCVGKGIITSGWCGEKGCAEKIEEVVSILSVGDGSEGCAVCGGSGKEIKVAKTY